MAKFVVLATMFLTVLLFATIISLFFIKFGWSLFMVPVFGFPELTWMQALGLSFLAGAFRSSNLGNKLNESK